MGRARALPILRRKRYERPGLVLALRSGVCVVLPCGVALLDFGEEEQDVCGLQILGDCGLSTSSFLAG